MILISKVLPVENVILDTDSTSKKRIFEKVGVLFEKTQHVARSQVFDSLFAREKLDQPGSATALRFRMDVSRVCVKRAGLLPRPKTPSCLMHLMASR